MTAVKDFWNTAAERYDRAYEAPGAAGNALRARLAAVLDLVGDGPGDALDVGMGAGRLCAELDRRGWRVSGVDLSPAMVSAARRRLPQLEGRLVEGSITRLPFPEEAFDAVTVTGVVEYVLDDLAAAMEELARVLRSGGLAIVSFPNHLSPVHLWRGRVLYPLVRRVKRVIPFGRPAPLALGLAAPGQLVHALAAAGFEIEAIRPVDVRPRSVTSERLARRLATQLVFAARRVR
jgi:SAM-dependent methyltransferase